jgi:ubiquinone/menaquinone biosynthesis C-methylase UbiE
MSPGPLDSTLAFWDANPCGVHSGFEAKKAQRYAMEPWIPALVDTVASRHRSILEIGCGQGVDAVGMCQKLAPDGRYLGLDYSPRSVTVATETARELEASLRVMPEFRVGNAEALDVESDSFEAAYSLGVLHHTADEAAAVREIHRVLRPGGTAYVCLYRKPSPKVLAAKLLRAGQSILDGVLGTDRCVYRWLARRGTSHPLFGTMFHECFGVPYMKWYTRGEIHSLFSAFDCCVLTPVGLNLGRLSPTRRAPSWGYMWLVEATKR